MIINTGQRTDIPAFYSEWFSNRLKEGFVCVRNPYNPGQVSRYRLDPNVVDVIGFCTKNPSPMFRYMDLLRDYGQYWFVTITPYGRDIEAYNTCKHLCKYCYANQDPETVFSQSRSHDPMSPFLIGNYSEGDKIHDVVQKSWVNGQMELSFD